MKSVNIRTVAAQIDATGFIDQGKRVGIRYVTMEGEIREMIISKRVGKKRKGTSQKNDAEGRKKPNAKREGLLQIVDHTRELDEAKTIFLYGIIGFNPDGDLNHLYPVL